MGVGCHVTTGWCCVTNKWKKPILGRWEEAFSWWLYLDGSFFFVFFLKSRRSFAHKRQNMWHSNQKCGSHYLTSQDSTFGSLGAAATAVKRNDAAFLLVSLGFSSLCCFASTSRARGESWCYRMNMCYFLYTFLLITDSMFILLLFSR